METIEDRAKRIVEAHEPIETAAALDAAAVLWAYCYGQEWSTEVTLIVDVYWSIIQRTEGSQ